MTIPDRMAIMAENSANLLARYIKRYIEREKIDEAEFCTRSGFPLIKINNLRLCRPPRRTDATILRADIETVAKHVGADPDRLFLILSDPIFIKDDKDIQDVVSDAQ